MNEAYEGAERKGEKEREKRTRSRKRGRTNEEGKPYEPTEGDGYRRKHNAEEKLAKSNKKPGRVQ